MYRATAGSASFAWTAATSSSLAAACRQLPVWSTVEQKLIATWARSYQ